MSGIEMNAIVSSYFSIVGCDLQNTTFDDVYGISSHINDCDISSSHLALGRDWRIKDCCYSDEFQPKKVENIDKSRSLFSWRMHGIGAVPISVITSPLPEKETGDHSQS